MGNDFALSAISQHIWKTKYCYHYEGRKIDHTVHDTWSRVAAAVSMREKDPAHWKKNFYDLLSGFRFLPGGRILAGAGTKHEVTLLNCFVMGKVDDSIEGIFDALKDGAVTMQAGGGIGYDFSTLRPKGSLAKSAGTVSSGPVSFMKIWNAMCATVLSTGARRGAMMATLRCDHPDISQFISEKSVTKELRHFNLSVLITDEFMQKLASGDHIDLKFADRTYASILAADLWDQIMKNTFEHSEPGVLFIDRINRENNLHYCESISATNPCGEIPLPPWGACNLGSLNLSQYVENSFSESAKFNEEKFKGDIVTSVRFLDNVVDLSRYPLPNQSHKEFSTRRLGLGVTGLGDAMAQLKLTYGTAESVRFVERVFLLLRNQSYRSSIELAKERGKFPEFKPEPFLQSGFCERLPEDIRQQIFKHGMRNSHVNAIAPTGTISLLANNVSSGIEPIFSLNQKRRILNSEGNFEEFEITDQAWRMFKLLNPNSPQPGYFIEAKNLKPKEHLDIIAAAQPFIDNSISKTLNVAKEITFDEFKNIYFDAYHRGLKGCTTFRPNPHTGSILYS